MGTRERHKGGYEGMGYEGGGTVEGHKEGGKRGYEGRTQGRRDE